MTDPVYVQRNGEGAITGIYARPQPGYAEEAIASDHADVVAFLTPSSVPQTITKLQAILAIKAFDQANNTDLMGSINDWIANNESEELKLRWEYATEIDRDSPLIALAKSALDLSDELLDALFSAAAQL